jgi:hypothetical protein
MDRNLGNLRDPLSATFTAYFNDLKYCPASIMSLRIESCWFGQQFIAATCVGDFMGWDNEIGSNFNKNRRVILKASEG